MIESLFDGDDNLHQIVSCLDQDHKYKIGNEKDDNYLAVEPAGTNKMYNIALITKQTHIYLSKPILGDYISRIAYYLGFRFENCTIEVIPI